MSNEIKKTKVINLFAGSGVGKSTLAMSLTSYLKLRSIHAEYVDEYMKKLAWEKRMPEKFDQISILGQQAKREGLLYQKVDYIFTDSPLLMIPFYEQYLTGKQIVEPAVLNFMKDAEEHNVSYHNFWLERIETFDTKGRFENKEQAVAIDESMKQWLKDRGVTLIELPQDHSERMRIVLEHLGFVYSK
jgi:nicotinamide riboside kinase